MGDRDLVFRWLSVASKDVPGVGDDALVVAFAQKGSLGMGGGGIAWVGRPDKSVTVHEVGHAFVGLLDEFRPDVVAVEQVFFQVNVRTAMSVGQASGLALCEAAAAGCEVVQYTPNQVKDAVARGARLAVGGGRHEAGALFYQPTLLVDVPDDASIMLLRAARRWVAGVAVGRSESLRVDGVDETYCEYRSTSFLDRFDGLAAIARTMS